MLVTDRHLEQYRDEGYCLVEGLIPSDLMVDVWRRVEEIITVLPTWAERHFQVLDPERYTMAAGGAIPAGIQRPATQEEIFRAVAEHANLAEAMARLLGGSVRLFTDQVGVKYGAIAEEQGGRSYFHQDSFYWHIDPELGCNCWIPMMDVAADAIALAVMPGSQRGWQLVEHESYHDNPPMGHVKDGEGFVPFKRHRIPLGEVDYVGETLVPMRAGDGLFFTNYTWHRSEPNRTGKSMGFYAIAYQIGG